MTVPSSASAVLEALAAARTAPAPAPAKVPGGKHAVAIPANLTAEEAAKFIMGLAGVKARDTLPKADSDRNVAILRFVGANDRRALVGKVAVKRVDAYDAATAEAKADAAEEAKEDAALTDAERDAAGYEAPAEAPAVEATGATKSCPACGIVGDVESLFGYRKMRRMVGAKGKPKTEIVEVREQSQCRKCRTAASARSSLKARELKAEVSWQALAAEAGIKVHTESTDAGRTFHAHVGRVGDAGQPTAIAALAFLKETIKARKVQDAADAEAEAKDAAEQGAAGACDDCGVREQGVAIEARGPRKGTTLCEGCADDE